MGTPSMPSVNYAVGRYCGCPKQEDSIPCYMLHNVETGLTAITAVKRCPRDLGSDLEDLKIWKDGEEWNQRWDIIMPYYIGGQPHLMFHDKDSKSYAWARVNDEANDITDLRQDNWSVGFDTMQYFEHPEFGCCYMAWNNDTGLISFAKIEDDGHTVTDIWSDTFSSKFYNIAPYYDGGGHPCFLVQRENDGPELVLCRVKDDGQCWDDTAFDKDTVPFEATHLMSWQAHDRPLFFAYNVDSGDASVFTIHGGGLHRFYDDNFGSAKFDVVSPMYCGNKCCMMMHKQSENYFAWATVGPWGIEVTAEDNWSVNCDNLTAFQSRYACCEDDDDWGWDD